MKIIERRYALELASMCLLLVLAACGGGQDTGSSSQASGQSGSSVTTMAVPDANGYYPDWRGLYPDANGRYPDWRGMYPDANGNYPDYQGLYPDANGRYPDYRGLYADAAGRYPDWRGLYPDSLGHYPDSDDAKAGKFANAFGWARSYSTLGVIDNSPANPFFKNFGNGRNCGSCHVQGNGFSLSPAEIQARFDNTNGTDPLFSLNDGANAPTLPVGTVAERRAAYSLLLDKGLLRIGRPVPTQTNDATPKAAEFVLDSIVSNPYNYASSSELSLYRRPLPATNLKFIASVMWDDRETIKDFGVPVAPDSVCIVDRTVTPPKTGNCYKSLNLALKNQANNATLGHAQAAAALSSAEQQAIVDFELSLFSAQEYDNNAQFLSAANAKGGTRELLTTPYYFDINSVFNDPVTNQPSPVTKLTAMSLYTAWAGNQGSNDAAVKAARQSIARGEKIFNTRTFKMVNVAGTRTTTINGATCTNCHSTPQVGSLAQPNLFGLGIGDPAWSSLPDLPTYTFRNVTTGANAGKTITVQDPGLALTTGKWADIGKFKVPALRGLAMRAPYFHDGSAKTIEDVTAFYIRRFVYDTPLSTQDIADLNAFLKSL